MQNHSCNCNITTFCWIKYHLHGEYLESFLQDAKVPMRYIQVKNTVKHFSLMVLRAPRSLEVFRLDHYCYGQQEGLYGIFMQSHCYYHKLQLL